MCFGEQKLVNNHTQNRGRLYGIILGDSFKSMALPFLFQDTGMNKPNPKF